jgi:hypothetical protein
VRRRVLPQIETHDLDLCEAASVRVTRLAEEGAGTILVEPSGDAVGMPGSQRSTSCNAVQT